MAGNVVRWEKARMPLRGVSQNGNLSEITEKESEKKERDLLWN
ncbi:MAG: hypothetical protein ACYSYL_17630 [Planctomycetota bacterium]